MPSVIRICPVVDRAAQQRHCNIRYVSPGVMGDRPDPTCRVGYGADSIARVVSDGQLPARGVGNLRDPSGGVSPDCHCVACAVLPTRGAAARIEVPLRLVFPGERPCAVAVLHERVLDSRRGVVAVQGGRVAVGYDGAVVPGDHRSVHGVGEVVERLSHIHVIGHDPGIACGRGLR